MVGAGDDAEAIVASAEALTAALATAGVEAALVRIPDMAHALADEPGLEPAPQKAAAAAVDQALANWLRTHVR